MVRIGEGSGRRASLQGESSTVKTDDAAVRPSAQERPAKPDEVIKGDERSLKVTGADDLAPSRAVSVRRPGATAQIDLQNWQSPTGGAELLTGSDVEMRNPTGPELAPWMRGEVADDAVAFQQRFMPKDDDREILSLHLAQSTVDELESNGFPRALLAEGLRRGVDPGRLRALIEHDASPMALRFVVDACELIPASRAVSDALHIIERWGAQADQVFEHLHTLAHEPHLLNKSDLNLWFHGLYGPGSAGEGYVTMLLDAVDLVQAGHDVCIELCSAGNGDIIDMSLGITYQHKRVTGRRIRNALQKAAKQLAGFTTSDGTRIEGAPPGHRGIVQLDARGNANFSSCSDEELAALVAEPHLTMSASLYEIQLVLDDRMLVFGRDQKLAKVVHQGERR